MKFNSKITAAALQAQVDALKQKAEAPVTNLIIRFDGRTGNIYIDALGDQVPTQLLYTMLSVAMEKIKEAEVKQKLAEEQIAQANLGAPQEVPQEVPNEET